MKKLYIVEVSVRFAAIAESEKEAMRFVPEVLADDEDAVHTWVAEPDCTGRVCPPNGHDDELVYGVDDDTFADKTFAQAVSELVRGEQ